VVKALSYKLEGHGIETRWAEWFFSIYIILPAAPGIEVYSVSNRNKYQKQTNNVSGEQNVASTVWFSLTVKHLLKKRGCEVKDGASQFQNVYTNFHKFYALLSMRLSQARPSEILCKMASKMLNAQPETWLCLWVFQSDTTNMTNFSIKSYK
jgi:hypothetical protein